MKKKYRVFLLIFLSIFFGKIYANSYNLSKDNCAIVETKDENLFFKINNCKDKNKLIDKIEFPSGSPSINFVSQEVVNNRNYIVLSMSYPENYRDFTNRFGYSSYNVVNVYECGEKCTINNKISNFFGSGGDVINLELNEIVYKFPYSNLCSIKNVLRSKLFNDWYLNKAINGEVINKTFINDVSNYTVDHLGYLVKGDKFLINNISAGWLDIIYKNKKGQTITGWILCTDTNLCH